MKLNGLVALGFAIGLSFFVWLLAWKLVMWACCS